MVLVMDIKDMDIQLAHILNETYIVRVDANTLSDFFRFVEHNFMILEGICGFVGLHDLPWNNNMEIVGQAVR